MKVGELRKLMEGVADDVDVEIEVRVSMPFVEQRHLTVLAEPYHATDWSKVTAFGQFRILSR